MNMGFRLFIVLNISVISSCRFFSCIVTDLSFSNKVAKLEQKSLYAILRALSCSLLILLFIFLLWNIQTNGQYWNWLVTNALIKSLNLSVPRYADIRDKANSLLPAVWQRLIKIPNNCSSFELSTAQLPIFMLTSWFVLSPNIIKWQTNVGALHSWLTTTKEGRVIISAFKVGTKVKSEEGIKEPVLQTLKPVI